MKKSKGILISLGIILLSADALLISLVGEPHSEELTIEKIPPRIIGTTQTTVEQETIERTHDVQMNVNEFSIEEAQLLLKVAQAEAGNQGEDGMWLVMSVVLNRRDSEQFPDTIKDVIYQKSQFSTVSNGAINKVEVGPECHMALSRIEKGEIAPEVIGFETKDSNTLDEYFKCVFGYRNHKFYVLKEGTNE